MAAQTSAAFATAGLDALVDAGAQNISFLAGNTSGLPEIAGDPNAQAIRNAFASRNEGEDRNKWLYSYNPLTVPLV